MASRRATTQEHVEVGLSLIAHHHSLETAGELTREEAQQAAIDAVRDLRYSEVEYFWINDMGPTMIMHPIKPELDGQDLSANEDPNGTRLFVEFVDVVAAEGGGFVDYLWPKPDEEEPQPKISYVAGFEPWAARAAEDTAAAASHVRQTAHQLTAVAEGLNQLVGRFGRFGRQAARPRPVRLPDPTGAGPAWTGTDPPTTPGRPPQQDGPTGSWSPHAAERDRPGTPPLIVANDR